MAENSAVGSIQPVKAGWAILCLALGLVLVGAAGLVILGTNPEIVPPSWEAVEQTAVGVWNDWRGVATATPRQVGAPIGTPTGTPFQPVTNTPAGQTAAPLCPWTDGQEQSVMRTEFDGQLYGASSFEWSAGQLVGIQDPGRMPEAFLDESGLPSAAAYHEYAQLMVRLGQNLDPAYNWVEAFEAKLLAFLAGGGSCWQMPTQADAAAAGPDPNSNWGLPTAPAQGEETGPLPTAPVPGPVGPNLVTPEPYQLAATSTPSATPGPHQLYEAEADQVYRLLAKTLGEAEAEAAEAAATNDCAFVVGYAEAAEVALLTGIGAAMPDLSPEGYQLYATNDGGVRAVSVSSLPDGRQTLCIAQVGNARYITGGYLNLLRYGSGQVNYQAAGSGGTLDMFEVQWGSTWWSPVFFPTPTPPPTATQQPEATPLPTATPTPEWLSPLELAFAMSEADIGEARASGANFPYALFVSTTGETVGKVLVTGVTEDFSEEAQGGTLVMTKYHYPNDDPASTQPLVLCHLMGTTEYKLCLLGDPVPVYDGGEAELIAWLQSLGVARAYGTGFPITSFTLAGETRTFELAILAAQTNFLGDPLNPQVSVGTTHEDAGVPCVYWDSTLTWSFCPFSLK